MTGCGDASVNVSVAGVTVTEGSDDDRVTVIGLGGTWVSATVKAVEAWPSPRVSAVDDGTIASTSSSVTPTATSAAVRPGAATVTVAAPGIRSGSSTALTVAGRIALQLSAVKVIDGGATVTTPGADDVSVTVVGPVGAAVRLICRVPSWPSVRSIAGGVTNSASSSLSVIEIGTV